MASYMPGLEFHEHWANIKVAFRQNVAGYHEFVS